MNLCSIASGSSGNCIYVGSDTTGLLVDVGISGKRIEEGLRSINHSTGACPESIKLRFIVPEGQWRQCRE